MPQLPERWILETPRLGFRHLRAEDLDALAAMYADPEMRHGFPEGTLTRVQTLQEIEWFTQGHPDYPALGLWAAIEKRSGAFVGRCGLLPWTIQCAFEVELAYLIDKRRWRQGLGTEAALGIARYAFQVLRLDRLVSLVLSGNAASAGVARACGMRLERVWDDGQLLTDIYALNAAAFVPVPLRSGSAR